jgi:putative peptidoglycan lipid II flippase
MVASTLITIASIAVYRALFHTFSVTGLAIASDLGIVANTLAAAILLHRRKLVSLAEFPWKEFSKTILVAVLAGGASWAVVRTIPLRGSRASDLESLALSTITWAGAVAAGLWLLRSDLPQSLRRRKTQIPIPPPTKPLPEVAEMEP